MKNNISKNSTKIRVIGNNFNERDADGNILVNIAYINKRNMTAEEAKEQIRKVEEYAKQEKLNNLVFIEDKCEDAVMQPTEGIKLILEMTERINAGTTNIRIDRINVANVNSVSLFYGNYLEFIGFCCAVCPKDGSLDVLPNNKYGAKFICLDDDYHFDPQNWDDEKYLDDLLEEFFNYIDYNYDEWV